MSNLSPELSSIPELVITPTTTQLFMFSAATWNRHRIHYDRSAALSEGHRDVVVHRALLGNFLARLLCAWLAGRGEVHQLSWKVLSSAVPGEPLRCQGEVVARLPSSGAEQLRCNLRIVNGAGAEVAVGSAVCVMSEPL